jgi:hypothetical protein
MATNQTAMTCQNFGHALALVVPKIWWGLFGLKPNIPLVLFSLSLFGIIYANRAVVFTPKNIAKVHTKGR